MSGYFNIDKIFYLNNKFNSKGNTIISVNVRRNVIPVLNTALWPHKPMGRRECVWVTGLLHAPANLSPGPVNQQ
jgi:hypothetical protein